MARNLGGCGGDVYPVSIKGIVLGSLFDLAMTFISGIVLMFVLTVSNAGDADVAMAAMCSPEWLTFQVVVASAVTVIAGYLAAWIAGRGTLINGTLCAVLTTAIAIPMNAGQQMPWPPSVTITLYVATPLLGLLGGYLRSRQVRGLTRG
jgi:hypothetical protein